MEETPTEAVVVTAGAKFYWRHCASLEYMIVEHYAFDVLELITYDHMIDRESPRIYLRPHAIQALLAPEKVEQALAEAKELKQRLHLVPDTVAMLRASVSKMRADYIVEKLDILERSRFPKYLHVGLNGNAEEMATILCSKPARLQRFVSPHYFALLEGEAEDKKAAEEKACAEVLRLSKASEEYEEKCGNARMTLNERWRTPIVFVKMQNGRHLGTADTKIWDKVMVKVWTPSKAAAALSGGGLGAMGALGAVGGAIVSTTTNVILDTITSLQEMLHTPTPAIGAPVEGKSANRAKPTRPRTGVKSPQALLHNRPKPGPTTPTSPKVVSMRSGSAAPRKASARAISIDELVKSKKPSSGADRRGSVVGALDAGRGESRGETKSGPGPGALSRVGRIQSGLSSLLSSVTGRKEVKKEERLKVSIRTFKIDDTRGSSSSSSSSSRRGSEERKKDGDGDGDSDVAKDGQENGSAGAVLDSPMAKSSGYGQVVPLSLTSPNRREKLDAEAAVWSTQSKPAPHAITPPRKMGQWH
ncbi:hypothetical protein B484DRAFT_454238 [Ochromonadaceae sp. CCMP2298]|nr:hypothetical protein B484DRAFT_454238 [Ochromonadaceae sp. CCMP2298]